MTKNKGKHKSEKVLEPAEEIRGWLDEALLALRPHIGKLAVLGLCVVGALVGVGLYRSHVERQNETVTSHLESVFTTLAATVGEEPPPLNIPGAELPRPGLNFKTAQERADASVVALEQFEQADGHTVLGQQAELLRAGALVEAGRSDEAIAAYERYVGAAHDLSLDFLALEGLGYAQEAKALANADPKTRSEQLSLALGTFQKLGARADDFYKDFALYHQARIKALLGQSTEALKLYEQILKDFPTTSLRTAIANRTFVLEQKS